MPLTPQDIANYAAEQAAKKANKKTAEDTGANWTRLLAQVDQGKIAADRQIIQWVFNHANSDPGEIDVDNIPSRGAIAMLKWVNTSLLNYGSFLTNIWTKTLPAKAQLDVEAGFNDDGRAQLELLAAFENDLNAPAKK